MSGCLSPVCSARQARGRVVVAPNTYWCWVLCQEYAQQSLLRRARLRGGLQANALYVLAVTGPTGTPQISTSPSGAVRAGETCRPACLLTSKSAHRSSKHLQRCRVITHGCHDPVFCPVPRRTHYLPQGPLKQELQGVALRRTRRVDGVRVVGPSLFALSERCAPQRYPPRRRRRGRDPCGGS